jgi:hypothetical protein
MNRQEQLAASLRECMLILERLVWLADVAEDEEDKELHLNSESPLIKDARDTLLHTQLVLSLSKRDEDIRDLVDVCRDIAMAPFGGGR